MKSVILGIGAVAVAAGAAAAVSAQQGGQSAILERIKSIIIDPNVVTEVVKPDHERLAVRRLDIVDENGTVRMTLAGRGPNALLDGVEYKRSFSVSGMTFYDSKGSERGGIGVADIPGSAVVLASDHAHHDAVGWRVMPDGSVSFSMMGREPMVREPSLGNKLLPGIAAKARLSMNLAPDGSPSLELADKQGRARIRLATSADGSGEIQFLNEEGKVVQRLSGEGLQGLGSDKQPGV